MFNRNQQSSSGTLTPHPLAAIGLQAGPRESLVLQAREQELLELKRQKNLLLDQRSEKEKLVIEALIQQGIIQGPKTLNPAVPTFTPTITTTALPTTRRTTTEAILPDLRLLVEEEKSSGVGFVNDESHANDEFEVEIILDMTRELVEAKRQEKIEHEKAEKAAEPQVPQSLEAIMRAREAVTKVMEAGSERNSPATWAAVKILSDFVDSQDPSLPSAVLESIIHLTQFLNMKLEEEPQELPRSPKKQSAVTSSPLSPAPALSPTQIKIREQIIRQKLLKQQKLKEIFMEKGSKSLRNEAPMVKITMKNSFPRRIDLKTEGDDRKQLPFSTLPIY